MNTEEVVMLSVRFQAQEGAADALEAALSELALASRKDAGCQLYDLYRSEGGAFLLMERWENRTLLDAHLKLDHVAHFRSLSREMLAEPPEILEQDPFDVQETQPEEE